MTTLIIIGTIIIIGLIYWKRDWFKSNWKKVAIASAGVALATSLNSTNDVSLEKLQQKYNASAKIKAEYQLDGASLVNHKIKNPELDKYKGEPKDEIKITLGDKENPNFVPNIEIKRWNEVSFKIKTDELLKDVPLKDRELEFADNKIKFKTPEMEFEMEGFEDSYKFIWYLNSKPASSTICFGIESSGLDFSYQPELTQQEIDEGTFRPEEIVGSYAIYHSTKGGMNDINGKDYKVGKFGHIPRPMLYDSNGREEFAERLLIKNNQYCVVMTEDFWNNAVYPIKSNDEFGYHTIGGSALPTSSWGDTIYTYPFTPGGSGTVNNIYFYCYEWTGDNDGLWVIYGATNRIDYTEVINYSGTYQWATGTAQVGATISAQEYYLGFHEDDTGNDDHVYSYDTDTGDKNEYQNTGYSSPPPATWSPFTSSQSRKFSIYVTYTPTAAGTNIQINISDVWKDVELMKINIGDVWKDVAGAWINIGDAWKVIY